MEDPKGTVGAPQSWDCSGAAVATKPAHALSLATEGSGLWGGRELRATAPVCPRQRDSLGLRSWRTKPQPVCLEYGGLREQRRMGERRRAARGLVLGVLGTLSLLWPAVRAQEA